MSRCQRKHRKILTFAYAIRSFIGYLEGTSKAAHTIKSYRSDLSTFQTFLEKELNRKPVALTQLTSEDLNQYHAWLKSQGQKTNTRRRKLLTVRRLLRYLAQRNKLTLDIGRKLPAPHKLEKIPITVQSPALISAIQALPSQTELDARNRVLLWTLAETGCLVSEIRLMRFEDWAGSSVGGASLQIHGKSERNLPVSKELFDAIQALQVSAGDRQAIFLGYNKYGSLGAPITPRGVELLVRAYAGRLGFPDLTPRTFRHSAVLRWYQEGLDVQEIRKRLGLRTMYAFRSYEPLFKSIAETTSTSQKSSVESAQQPE